MLAATWWMFLAGGISRLYAWLADGPPSGWIIALTAVELVLPPLMQRQVLATEAP